MFLGYKIKISKKFSYQGKLGIHYLNNDVANKNSSHAVGSIKSELHPSDELWLSFKLGREFIYPQILPLTSNSADARADNLNSFLRYNLTTNTQLQFKNQLIWLKDTNRRITSDAQIMYAISKYPHWILIGLGMEHQQNTLTNQSYWSPGQFFSYGLRFDTNFNLSKNFSFFLGGSVNSLSENGNSGNGHYLQSGLQIGNSRTGSTKLFYEDIKSTQAGKAWTSGSFGLSFGKQF